MDSKELETILKSDDIKTLLKPHIISALKEMLTSQNIDQIYIANPITTNASTDLIYIGQSPYSSGDDAAITYANFAAQFGAPYIAAALTKTNDTNVTLTLGGTPNTALLEATSLTLGWTGTLSGARGGTGTNNSGLTINLGSATTGYVLTSDSSGNATWQAIPSISGAALTKVNDTNVTLTLGGTPSTALLEATSITAGWTGTLAGARGGTGIANTGLTINLGSATTGYVLTSDSSGNATWQATAAPTGHALTETNDTNVTLTLGGSPTTALLAATSITAGWTGTLAGSRGGLGAAITASNGGIYYSTASSGALLAGTATANQVLLSGSSTTPAWSTATYPATTTVNQLLYSSSANTIAGLATANSSVLITSAGGVPSLSTTLPSGIAATNMSLTTPALGTPSSGTLTNCTGLPVGGGGTGNSTFTAYSVICAGTTATGAFQNVSGLGTSGYVLTSNGAGALPTWQAAGGGGPWSSGTGSNSALGGSASNASGADSLAWGSGANASGAGESIALCTNSSSQGIATVAIGNDSTVANVSSAIAIGYKATALNDYSIVLCCYTNAINDTSTAQLVLGSLNGTFIYCESGGSIVFNIGTTSSHTTSATIDTHANFITQQGGADQSYTIATPSSGGTVTIVKTNRRTILNPSGTLATLTVNLPSSSINGQLQTITTTQIITALTVGSAGSDTIVAAPTTLAVGQSFTMIYDLGATTWYPG